MRELIEWVMAVESTAAEIYELAAVRLGDDRRFADFVRTLAAEEREHGELMQRALGMYDESTGPIDKVSIDPESKRDIEQLLRTFREMISGSDFSSDSMAELIVLTEFSELNDVFMKVCNTMRQASDDFANIAARIQKHKDDVEIFIGSRPELSRHLDRIRRLPNV